MTPTSPTHPSRPHELLNNDGRSTMTQQHPCRWPWRHDGALVAWLCPTVSSPTMQRPLAYSTLSYAHTLGVSRVCSALLLTQQRPRRLGKTKHTDAGCSGHYGLVEIKRKALLDSGAHHGFETVASYNGDMVELDHQQRGRRQWREPMAKAYFGMSRGQLSK